MGGLLSREFFKTAVPRAKVPRRESARPEEKALRPVFGAIHLADLTADDIEEYLRDRLRQRVIVQTKDGPVKKGVVKSSTVHQEFRVLRRMLNVSVRKKMLFANPCAGVEFPTRVDGLFRPHYMNWSEQQKIEGAAPEYLRNVIQIIAETGLRVYKELIPMRVEHVDLPNRVVWIPDSKTPNGVSEATAFGYRAEGVRAADGYFCALPFSLSQ